MAKYNSGGDNAANETAYKDLYMRQRSRSHLTENIWVHKPDLLKLSCCFHLNNNDNISSNFRIFHDCSAVVTRENVQPIVSLQL